jgi:hypothetical protein
MDATMAVPARCWRAQGGGAVMRGSLTVGLVLALILALVLGLACGTDVTRAQSPAAQSPAAQSPAAQSPAAQSPAAQSPAAQSLAAQSLAAKPPAAKPPAPAAPPSIPASQVVGLLGVSVEDAAGKSLGRVVDVLVDAGGHPQAAIIDVGGFLGVGNRKVAVDWDALRFMLGKSPHATLAAPAAEIKAAPAYDPSKPVVAIGTASNPPPPAAGKPPPPGGKAP